MFRNAAKGNVITKCNREKEKGTKTEREKEGKGKGESFFVSEARFAGGKLSLVEFSPFLPFSLSPFPPLSSFFKPSSFIIFFDKSPRTNPLTGMGNSVYQ